MLRPQPFLTQLVDLTLIQLSNWRWGWGNMVIAGTILPIFSMISLGFFAQERGPEAITYIYVGSLIIALLFSHMGRVAANFSYMRVNGSLNFLATLPIHRHTFMLATLLSFFIIFLPSLLITILLGAAFLSVPLHPHVLVILILPLISMPLAAFGALMGASSRRIEDAVLFSQIAMLTLVAVGPVMVPPDQLPEVVIVLGRLNPATYAVSALKQVLVGPVSGQLAWDVAFLLVFTLGSLWLASRLMDWREN
jgi:ABC-2 type transport system permease protein